MNVSIKPVNVSLDTLEIVSVNVNLDKSAYVTTYVKNSTGMGYTNQLFMDTETYLGWSDDDEYVVNWALNELELQKA
jgi:hypothetical protein